MTELPPPPRARVGRLLMIRALIILGVLLAIAMGVGIALQPPPPERPDAPASR